MFIHRPRIVKGCDEQTRMRMRMMTMMMMMMMTTTTTMIHKAVWVWDTYTVYLWIERGRCSLYIKPVILIC